MTDDTKLVPCLMCMDQGLYTCKGHHETMTINASKLNPVPERDEVYESVKRGLEGGGSHDLGTFSDETKLVPCSICPGEVLPITSGDDELLHIAPFDIAQCPKCYTTSPIEHWNRLHGGTRIEVEGCVAGSRRCDFYDNKFCRHPFPDGKLVKGDEYPHPKWCPLRTVNQGPTTIGIKEVE